ncbi:MAG: CDP-glycerol glycerophosphotransferase family protein [Eubacterium sp.]|nr:CDP-glycerol glycerophosphotransferase family protein [Eubacterium sp.]
MKKINDLWRVFVSIILVLASKFIKRRKNWLAFGAWKGTLYIDNSRYLLETALSSYGKDYVFVWIGNSDVAKKLPKDSRIRCVKMNSFKSIRYLLRCKYMFCSQMHFEDLSNYNVFKGAVITYLHHGCPLKRWGDDASRNNTNQKNKRQLVSDITGRNIKYNYFVCSSEAHFIVNLSALKSRGCNDLNNLRTGTPRNDLLFKKNNKESIEKYKSKYSKLLKFEKDKRVVLYVPTFRRSGVCNESLVYRDSKEIDQLKEILDKHNCVLIEKAHFAGKFNNLENYKSCPEIIPCPKNVNLQEMLLFTDCMISDYSGAFLDYSILDRPVIHYIYDYEFYRDVDSGLYYDFEEFQCGMAARNYDELLNSLDESLSDADADDGSILRDKVRHKFMEYEKGNASMQILKKVVGNI